MADMSSFTEGQFSLEHSDDAFHTEQMETSLSRGPTELLQDSVIRNEGGEENRRGGEEKKEGRKTSLPYATKVSLCQL